MGNGETSSVLRGAWTGGTRRRVSKSRVGFRRIGGETGLEEYETKIYEPNVEGGPSLRRGGPDRPSRCSGEGVRLVLSEDVSFPFVHSPTRHLDTQRSSQYLLGPSFVNIFNTVYRNYHKKLMGVNVEWTTFTPKRYDGVKNPCV